MAASLAIAVRTHLLLTALGAIVAQACAGPLGALSLLGGAAFALGNLWFWSLVVRGFTQRVAERGPIQRVWFWSGLCGKLLAFTLLGAGLLGRVPIEPLSFAAGVALLSVAFVGLVWVGPTARQQEV